ncbi:MAG TPA: dienelactone hydrolase family protein [Gammaproteobacteria bacterium]|jgi:phospholipase/carboxylesterase
MLEAVEVETAPGADRSIIWLHGLGADGHDFEPLVPELALPFAVRFVFPHAPVRRVTINAGMAMRAWYDLVSLDRGAREDETGIRASAGEVTKLIEQERARGSAPQRIVLAGFSQGGAIALQVGLRAPDALAGVVALSTYLPLARSVAAEQSAASHGTPIWMAHGDDDPVIALASATASRDFLEQLGLKLTWHTYPMGHSVCAAEVRDLRKWLMDRLR